MHAERLQATVPYPSGPPRTPGVHESGLIRAMAVQYGILDKKWITEEIELIEVEGDGLAWWNGLDEDSKIRMSIGLAWEAWYLPQIPGVTWQPGELCIAGIYATPDGHSLEFIAVEQRQKVILAIHEVKTTSKSTNTVGDLNIPNPKNWIWLTQAKIICAAAGTTVVYVHILYLYGDYTRPYKPQLHIWRIEFEHSELEAAVARLCEYRDAHVGITAPEGDDGPRVQEA